MGSWKHIMARDDERGWSSPGDKYVCSECVFDYALKAFVLAEADSEGCDYCGEAVPTIHVDHLIEKIANSLYLEWGNPDEELPYETREGGYQGAIYDTDEIIDDAAENQVLQDDIIDAFRGRLWCERDYFGLKWHQALSVGWMAFCDLVKHHNRYMFLSEEDEAGGHWSNDGVPAGRMLHELGELIKELGLVHVLPADTDIYRARLSSSGESFMTAAELGSPPTDRALYASRMSAAGISMFYGAFDPDTCLKELDYDQGKHTASIARFKTTSDSQVVSLTDVPSIPSIYDDEQRRQRDALRFLHEFLYDFAKPITKDDKERIDYVPTQIVTEFIRYSMTDGNGGKLVGVKYPSARERAGECIVLFVDNDGCLGDEDGRGRYTERSLRMVEVQNRVPASKTRKNTRA